MALDYSLSITGTCGGGFLGSITIIPNGGTSPYIVDWQNPNLGTDVNVSSSTRNNLVANEYFVRISDSTSPSNEVITISIPVKDNVCCRIEDVSSSCGSNNGSVTASTSSLGSSYSFKIFSTNDAELHTIFTSDNTVEFINLTAGTYYIVSTNIYGCSGRSETFIVDDSSDLQFGLYVVPNATCGITNLGKIYITGLTGNPPFTYTWNNGQTGTSITGLSQGSYSVEVTDGKGCSKIQSAIVNSVDPLGLVKITPSPPTCLQSNGNLKFEFSGGTLPYYYLLSNGIYGITFSNEITISGLSSGNYTLDVTDAAFCKSENSYSLISPSGLSSVEVITKNSSCSSNNGSFTVNVQGGVAPYTYTLVYPDSNTNTNTTNAQSIFFLNLSGGTYSIFVSDSSGCSFSEEYLIVSDEAFSLEINTTGSTFNKNNGILNVVKSSGGTQPFNYLVDGNVVYSNTTLSAVTIGNLSPGQHEIKVSDSNQCFQKEIFTIDSQPVVDFFLNIKSDGTSSGNTLTALISDGKPPFTFYWSSNVPNNPQSITATGLTAGTYSLTVVDKNKSSLKRNITIPGSRTFTSYGIFTVAKQEFTNVDNTKYSISKMFNEGFQDITSGNTGCKLSSATFTAQVEVLPFGTITSQQFYTSTSLLTVPPDNIWYDSIKNLLLQTIGVKEVIINESDNTLTIVSDRARSEIIDGTFTAVNLKVYLIIDYNINCSG